MTTSKTINGVRIIEANRFSRWLDPEPKNLTDLEKWMTWFTECGIPCALATKNGQVAVFREGMDEDS